MFRFSAGVPNDGIFHPADLPKDRLDSPKTAGPKSRFFRAHRFTIKREINRCNRFA
jgi:hypothetical protein